VNVVVRKYRDGELEAIGDVGKIEFVITVPRVYDGPTSPAQLWKHIAPRL